MRSALAATALLVVFGGTAGATAAGAGGVAIGAGEPPPARTNVLFIAVDDLRPELGCYGVEHADSPRLDAFAATAMLFEQHYVQAPSCGASRAALLTGQSPARSGRLSNESLYRGSKALASEATGGAQTLPELFRRNGYRTVCVGKISHTPDGRVFAYSGHGDGSHELPHAWDQLATPFGPWGRGWGAFFAYADGRHREDGQGHRDVLEFTADRDIDLPDGLLARAAASQLEGLSARDEPFFLGVGFFKPHLPFVAPRADREALAPVDVPPPAHPAPLVGALARAAGSRSGEFYGYDAPWAKSRPLPEEAAVEARRAYLACVRYVDRQIGLVLDALDRTGLAESTIVIVWGDHGWHLGESGIWGKHTLLDRSLQSALLVRAPGVTEPGSRCAAVVETLDLYPTLVDLCALEDRATAAPLDGTSLRPLLEGGAESARGTAASYWGDRATLRTQAHRLIARRVDPGVEAGAEWEPLVLVDVTDPLEDVSAEHAEVVAALLAELAARDR